MLIMCTRARPMSRLLGTLGNQSNGEGTRLMVVCLLILNPGMTQVHLAQALNMSPAAVQEHVRKLKDVGAISATSAVNEDVIIELTDFLSTLIEITQELRLDKFRKDMPCRVELGAYLP